MELVDCRCGRRHASWWRTVQAPSCTVPIYVYHHGLFFTPVEWELFQEMLARKEDLKRRSQ
jgi:hypothetical protein